MALSDRVRRRHRGSTVDGDLAPRFAAYLDAASGDVPVDRPELDDVRDGGADVEQLVGGGSAVARRGGLPDLGVPLGWVAERAALAAHFPIRRSLAMGGLYKPLEWLFWAGNDVGRFLRYGSDSREFGIICYCGLFGAGKTASAVERAWQRKKLLGDKLKIYSNIPISFADGPIRGIQQLKDMHQSEYNTIFIFDEVHLTWTSGTAFSKVDPEFMQTLTQMRKVGPGFAVYLTTQRLNQAAIIWRRLAQFIVDCEGHPTSRWIHQKWFQGIEEYNEGVPRFSPITNKDMRNVYKEYSFIASDYLRFLYRTDWIAGKTTETGQSENIGVEAVLRKIEAERATVQAQLALRNAADQAAYASLVAQKAGERAAGRG